MKAADIAFGIGCLGVGLVTLGSTGLLLGAFDWKRRTETASGFDPFGIAMWARHRREAGLLIAGGVLVVLLVQPFLNK
jgi:hypothetical protein